MEFALHKILRAAAVYPDKVAIRDQAGELTYAQLETLARRIAAALISRGIEKGDMVAIELPRVKEYTAAMLGCWLSGAGFAPLVALSLSSRFGLFAVGGYLLSGALCTLVALTVNRRLELRE